MRCRSGLIAVSAIVLVLFLSGCESLRSLIPQIERPTAEVESVRVSSLSFSDVGLLAEIAIENPNPIGITLSGFAYSLSLEGVQVVSGDQPRGLSIESFDRSVVELPVLLEYQSVFESVSGLRDRNEAAYEVAVDLRFDLPVLGPVTIPVRQQGTLPVVRPPRVRVSGLRLESIGITGARLELEVAVENPNSFALSVDELDYSFIVQQREWAGGGLDRPARVAAEGSEELTFGFRLNFAEFGRTVRDILLGDDEISYAFTARAAIDPDFELLPDVVLPFDRTGSIPLRR